MQCARILWTSASAVLLTCLGYVGGCGGSAFTSGGTDGGSGSPSDASSEAAPEAAPDGPPSDSAGSSGGGDGEAGSSGVQCGATVCTGTAPLCCATTSPTCAHVNCGCTTELACTSDAECGGAQPVCCISQVMDAVCPSGRLLARCSITCGGDAARLCTAADTACPSGRTCSMDSGDLQNVGLPSGQGIGVCK
jgi:hypothetical protein